MGFFDILRTKAQNNYNLTWTLNAAGQWVYPNDNSDNFIDDGYNKLPNIYAIISFILSKSTIVPFEVMKVKSISKERKYKALMNDPKNHAKAMRYKAEAYDRVDNTELEALLLNPNSYQSLEDLWWETDGYKLLTGNSYVYGIGLGTKPKELHSIPSTCVDINVKGSPFDPQFFYKVNYLTEEIPGDDIMHFKYWNPIKSSQEPGQQFKGKSPLQSCRLLLGRYADADISQGSMFKNQGPSGILTGEDSQNSGFGEEQAIALNESFKQKHTGTYKANGVVITPNKMSWTRIGLSPVDLNILESKRDILSEACNVYNVPVGLLSDTNSTENNMIESRKALITDAVMPLVEARKAVLNKFLCPKFGPNLRIEFDYTVFPEIQEDMEKQSKIAMSAYILTVDERRAVMGYDNLDEAEKKNVLIPSGLSTLEDLYSMPDEIDEPLLDPNAK